MKGRPLDLGPVAAVAAVVAGVLAAGRAGPGPAVFVLLGAIAFGAVGVASRANARPALVGIALLLGGFACMQRAENGMAFPRRLPAPASRAYVSVRGEVASDPDGPSYSTDLLLRASVLTPDRGGPQPLQRLVLIRATSADAETLRILATGDRVTVSGRLEPLDGYDARLRWRHVVARVVEARLDAMQPPSSPLFRVANGFRDATIRGAAGLAPNDRALFTGFLLGDTRNIPDWIVVSYRDAGLSHLLAVSGANVAFVLALFGPFLRRGSLRTRLVIGISVIVVFAAATRFEPSVLRASVMAAIAMSATFLGRPASSLRTLSYAVVGLLLVDPFLLHSVGFLLSVGACAGIALGAGPIARRLRGPRFIRETLAVTIAAQVGVAPVLLCVFGAVPAIAPITNLLAVPVAEPLTIYGFVSAFVLAVIAPLRPLAPLVTMPTAVMLHWVTFVARRGAAVPVDIHARAAIGLVAVGGFVGALRRAAATLRTDGAHARDRVADASGPADSDAVPEPAPR
jgi:competence protein ComEC